MKIAIAGYGFVGKAHHELLKDKHDIIIHDPALGFEADFADVDAVIVCVSTPPNAGGGCKMDNVYEVIEQSPDIPILIKSTISVEGWQMLVDTFPNKQICFSPEFLRQASWEKDAFFDHMYLGGNCTAFWSDIYLKALGKLSI